MSLLPGKDPSLVDATSFGATGSSSRRRFLQAVGLGGVAASVPLAAVTANASAVVVLPRRPTEADTGLLAFAQQVELAIFGAYDIVVNRLKGGSLTMADNAAHVVHALREHHLAYTQSLAALLGRAAPGVADATLMKEITAVFPGGTQDEILAAAVDLENRATATHGTLVGTLEGVDGAALIASIMSMEARHSTALAILLGTDPTPTSGIEDLSAALSPASPVE